MAASEELDYSQLHVAFVSNHSGTSAPEAVQAILPTLVSYGLLAVWESWLNTNKPYTLKNSWRFIVEFVVLVGPQLLTLTVLNNYITHVLVFQALLFIPPLYNQKLSTDIISINNMSVKLNKDNRPTDCKSSKFAFLTNFRATVNFVTCMCILAVDFQIFPRRFAKTEDFGFSVMDIGVGGFVITHAMVSPESRNLDTSSNNGVARAIRSSIPLVALGGSRLFATQAVEYHEHVTEYGTHWNFFLTLAVVKVISAMLLFYFSANLSGLLSIVMITFHEWLLLDATGLGVYILKSSDGKGGRNNWLDANREGLFSIPGYVSLYLAGVRIGQYCFQPRRNFLSWVESCMRLTMLTGGLWFVTTLSSYNVHNASRRMCNLTYMLWVLSAALLLLTAGLAVDLLVTSFSAAKNKPVETHSSEPKRRKKKASAESSPVQTAPILNGRTPLLLEAINRNGLLYFLLANILTGIVNVSFPTIFMDVWQSLLILVAYQFILCSVICALHYANKTVRFW